MSRRAGSALVTVLFTDIVGSTEIATEMGNQRWRELLARHHRMVRQELRRFRGREIDTAGDGFFATFDRPAQAIRCAWAITEAVRGLGIEVRAGLHVGEAELMGKQVGGVAVHLGARIGAQAGPGEVLVSGTLRDLVPGTGLEFEDRGWKDLKGISEPQRLYVVKAVDGHPRSAPLPAGEATRRRATVVAPPPLKRRGVLAALGVAVAVAVVAATLFLTGDEPDRRPGSGSATNAVVRVDAEAGRAGEPIGLPSGPTAFDAPEVAIGQGAVWVNLATAVCRVDPATGAAEAIGSGEHGGDQMALGLRAVWISRGPEVRGINPITLATEVEYEVAPENVFQLAVATAGGSVWLGYDDRLIQVDPHTGAEERMLRLRTPNVDELVPSGRDLWIVDRLRQSVFVFDTARLELALTVPLQVVPDEVAVASDGTLWVTNSIAGTLTAVESDGTIGSPRQVATAPSDVAVGVETVWVSDAESRTVNEVDPLLGEVIRRVPVPGRPDSIAVDPATGDVWVYLR